MRAGVSDSQIEYSSFVVPNGLSSECTQLQQVQCKRIWLLPGSSMYSVKLICIKNISMFILGYDYSLANLLNNTVV